MKRYIPLLVLFTFHFSIFTSVAGTVTDSITGRKYKTGWTFGALPSVAYDADLGFQGGALANIYYYGDGSTYPDYLHSIYFEAAYTTGRRGIFRGFFDTKALIPHHRLTLDATYLPDAMCDFYGFNGYQSIYHADWVAKAKKIKTPEDAAAYRSRAFYKYKRDIIRFAADIEGTIYKDLKWNAGIGVLGYMIDTVNTTNLNGKKVNDEEHPYKRLPANVDMPGLYQKYQDWGLIQGNEARGGWHPYARVGLTYDTRDSRSNPAKGIYADAFFTYSAAFNSERYGQQAEYNNLRFNFTFRHYVTVYPEWVTFAYRVGTQNVIAGKSPFYSNTYLNTLFIQRVIYEGLGGGNSLRGVLANRINADGFLYATVEFRAKFVKFNIKKQAFYVGLNPFFDFGMVTQAREWGMSIDDLQKVVEADGEKFTDFFSLQTSNTEHPSLGGAGGGLYRPHLSAGIGLKVGMNENFVLSVDYAAPFSKQDSHSFTNFYVKMGYLF